MAEKTIPELTLLTNIDRSADLFEVSDTSDLGNSYSTSVNNMLNITGAPVGTTDIQTLTNKTLTAPAISDPVLSGTITGTYTLGGTPTFPSAVVTLTGSQTLTNKTLTSPTITTPTINNPTLNTDAVNEFTSANGVTIDGLNIKDGKLNTNNSVLTANITNASVTSDKLATGAQQALVATAQTTTSTSFTDLTTTTDTVTVTIGANGLALVIISSRIINSDSSAGGFVGVAVSGANTIAVSDANSLNLRASTGAPDSQCSWSYLATGLTPGSTTFKLKYRVTAGTGTFTNRRITVIPL